MRLSDAMRGKLGARIPETIVLENGKPKWRYFLDITGQLKAFPMKTSAELLRVLRDFSKQSWRPREGPQDIQSQRPRSVGGERFTAEQCQEVAILHFVDGTERLMTRAEADGQMRGANKLPRAFWQDVRMLQAPVRSSRPGAALRYISYTYDSRGTDHPQVVQPSFPGRRFSVTDLHRREAARAAVVPRNLNGLLSSQKLGELISGHFEFVCDEADGTLWLLGARRLLCRRKQEKVLHRHVPEPEEEQVRYFEEEEFDKVLREEELRFERLKTRFRRGELSAMDKLAGVTVDTCPDLADVLKFYDAEAEMLRHFREEVCPKGAADEALSGKRGITMGVCFWHWARLSCHSVAAKVRESSRTRDSSGAIASSTAGLSSSQSSADMRLRYAQTPARSRSLSCMAITRTHSHNADRVPRRLTAC